MSLLSCCAACWQHDALPRYARCLAAHCCVSHLHALLPQPSFLQSRPLPYKWASPLEQKQRLSAVECWWAYRDVEDAEKRIRLASNLMVKNLKMKNCPPKRARHIRTWVENLEKYGTLSTRRAPGAQIKLPKSAVKRAIELLYEGWESEGRQLAYTSINEALQHSPDLAAILTEHKIKPDTLLRRMRKLLPSVKKRLLFLKRQLTPEQQQARLDAVKRLLKHWPVERLDHVMWVDATTIILKPRGIKVYLPPGSRALVFSDDRLQRHSSNIRKLKFYICVNAILGPVALVFTSGTTDLPSGGWTVSGWRLVLGGWPGGGVGQVTTHLVTLLSSG